MRRFCAVLSLTILAVAGCRTGGSGAAASSEFARPSIAVMKFENRAPFPLSWDLGTGTRDVLVDRLVRTERYQVIERPELDSVVREINFQHSGLTRPQDKARLGQIKNVQYLIKGTITDFTHVASSGGFLSGDSFSLFGGGNRAVMAMTLYVVDVESGQIICSETIQESVHARDMNVRAVYKDVAFGGSVFYKTPLGEATAHVIDKAVGRITGSIAAQPWIAKVAALPPDGTVIINGGRDRGLNPGQEFEIISVGPPILDPDTGDQIGHQGEAVIARVRVSEIKDRYAVAQYLARPAGVVEVSMHCRKAGPGIQAASAN